MLSPEKAKLLLSHDDAEVRDQAVYYFEKRYDHSMVSADELWQVIDKVGVRDGFRYMLAIPAFQQSDNSVQRLLDHASTAPDNEAEDILLSLRDLPFHWLVKYRDQIQKVKMFKEALGNSFLEYLKFPELSVDELWTALTRHADKNPDNWSQAYLDRGLFLARALAEKGDAIRERAIDLLQQDRTDSFAELFAIHILADLKAPELITILPPRLELYDDLQAEASLDALVAVASPALVAQLEEQYAKGNADFAITAAEILARYSTSESQRLLLRMAKDCTDDRSYPCHELIHQLPDEPDVLEFLRKEATEQTRGDMPPFAFLHEEMLLLGKMIGIEFPEAEQWRKKDFKRTSMLQQMLKSQADWDEKAPDEFKPIASTPKVSRNDPCPCGSGKKYKKCCLGKGDIM